MPITESIRSTFTPGVSRGTSTIVCRACRSASGSVSPMNTKILQSGWPTPVDHHLLPLMTTSSPSTTAVAAMLVASEDATSGSVIVNALRISACSSGSSQVARCSSVPYFSSTSMLPVSGALQLKTCGASAERPVSSAIGA